MVRLDWAAVLLAGAAVVKAVTPHAPSFVPGAYIVEYEEDQVSGSFPHMSLSPHSGTD